jgi:hypothetical protein
MVGKMKIKTYCAAMAIALHTMLYLSVTNAATFYTKPDENPLFPNDICQLSIHVDGIIDASDLDKLKRIVDQSCTKVKTNKNGVIEYSLSLNSEGGDVDSALAIGRYIRNINLPVKSVHFKTEVWGRYHCYSSCVLILAAGSYRLTAGKIGIHRPYFVQLDSKYSTEEIRRIRAAMNKNIKEYLVEMDVAESLLDAMLAVPAEQIKVLTDDQLAQYRLTGADANYEEKRTAEDAKKWYLSSAAYRERLAAVKSNCGYRYDPLNPAKNTPDSSERYTRCEATTMLKISDAEYQKRQKKIVEKCLTPTPKNWEQSHFDCADRVRAGK